MLELKNVQVKYGDFIAVDDISFKVEKGEFFTLLGPSGCGKSTVLKSIAGFKTPSKGQIILAGEDITYKAVEKRDLGMVFQSYALFQTMTSYENIVFGLKVAKASKEKIKERVDYLARLVNLNDEQLNRNVSELSGGQQQRVAIARALAKEPETMLLDEPLSNLDAKLRKQLRNELKKIQRDAGMTSVYVTHDQEEALSLSDKIAVFNNGYIEQIGTPRDIYEKPKTEFVCNFIGDANLLSSDFIREVNRLGNCNLNESAKSYIRIEKIKNFYNELKEGQIEIPVEVIDRTYSGTTSIYTLKFNNLEFKSLEKEGGKNYFEIGDKVNVAISPKNILQYDEKGRLYNVE
ncbi:ABC transporter ATP-binding protein [Helcococcus kunzii]|uniref:ABC transporter ATP-binding protein n=1 Tax=Helcococcus kunzii TaxID=40091 RepID=UPI0024AD630A|nr:ABC transporter ATP-binding protein [Helcococcus kunzii]